MSGRCGVGRAKFSTENLGEVRFGFSEGESKRAKGLSEGIPQRGIFPPYGEKRGDEQRLRSKGGVGVGVRVTGYRQ